MRLATVLTLVLFMGCVTAPVGDAPVVQPAPTPWTCAVEVQSYFIIVEDGKLVKPSTLLLRKAGDRMVRACGTGTVIRKDGTKLLILTAKHVIDGAESYNVVIKGRVFAGYHEKLLPDNDVATFWVDVKDLADDLLAAPLARSLPDPGQELELVGNPLGIGLKWMRSGPMGSDQPKKIMGITVWPGSYHSYPGCSGASLWHNGKVVGVVSMVGAIRTLSGNVPLADMGYFVGIEDILKLVEEA
jgi:hypothetical protein